MSEKLYEMERAYSLVRAFFSPEVVSDEDLESQFSYCKQVIKNEVTVGLDHHQREALVSLLSDLVGGRATGLNTDFYTDFYTSITKTLNAGQYQIAGGNFFHFVYHDGRVDPSLWAKRTAEQHLFRRGHLALK